MRADTVVSASLIREARMRAGLSQVQLAERSGKAKVQIGRWETGVVAPSIDTLLEIVRVCGFDLPLMLEPHRPIDDRQLTELQRYSPERRLEHMLDRLEREHTSGPASQGGRNPFEGYNTRRIYALADKSRAFDCFPIHETVLKLNDYFLQPNYLMTSYHTVNIEPGSVEQSIHTDDGLIPLPRPRPLMGIVGIVFSSWLAI